MQDLPWREVAKIELMGYWQNRIIKMIWPHKVQRHSQLHITCFVLSCILDSKPSNRCKGPVLAVNSNKFLAIGGDTKRFGKAGQWFLVSGNSFGLDKQVCASGNFL